MTENPIPEGKWPYTEDFRIHKIMFGSYKIGESLQHTKQTGNYHGLLLVITG